MQKFVFSFLIIAVSLTSLNAQKFFTRNGKISFFSDAPMEKIEAVNNSANSVIDVETGAMEFAVLIKGFQFEKALMQEHFNENYMESSEFPKALFKGQIKNMDDIQFNVDGEYTATVTGDLTIHGVTKKREVIGTFYVKNGMLSAKSEFDVVVADHEIEIPGVVRDNIAKTVKVTVEMNYEPFNK